MRRGLLLALTLCAVAASDAHDVRLLQPKAKIVLSGPRGTSLPFQAWVARHPDNRWVQLEVWLDGMRVQSSGWDIDGDAAAVQPAVKPLIVHLAPGTYAFRVLACSSVTDQSECGRVRASAVQEVRVCAGDLESC
jgi:hypothetical protein